MQTVGQIIREHRLGLGLTLSALAQSVGVAKSYLSMIENHRVVNPPSGELLVAMERALEIESGQLSLAGDWARAPQAVREQVQRLSGDAERGRELARFLKEAATASGGAGGGNLDDLYRSGQLRRRIEQALGPVEGSSDDQAAVNAVAAETPPLYRIPLINKVAAGYPTGFTDLDYPARVADSYLSCPGLNDPDAFAATVVGDSMMPDYREGDIVVFSPAADVGDGCDCFVRLEPDHETTFKRVFFDEGGAVVRMQPLNPQFPPTLRAREQVAGLYRAVWRYSKL